MADSNSLAARIQRYFDNADTIADGIAAQFEGDPLQVLRTEFHAFTGAVRQALVDIAAEVERLSVDRDRH